MKRIGIKMMAVSYMIMLLLSFSACGGKASLENQLKGSWYLPGNDIPAFTLYDDGSCEIDGEYGTGTWSVVNENQLKLTNYYGETETATIEEVADGTLILSSDGHTTTFVNMPEVTQNISGEGIDSEVIDSLSSSLDAYQIEGFIWFDCDDDRFWVRAIDDKTGQSVNLLIGKELDLLYILDSDRYSIKAGPYDGLTLVENITESKLSVLDSTGTDVSNQYIDEESDGAIISVQKDSTGVTVWTYETEDTYDSHVSTVNAKDIGGKLKQSWQVNDSAKWYSDISLVDGSTYICHQEVFNVELGSFFEFPPSGNHYNIVGVDNDGSVFARHESGTNGSLIKYSNEGNELKEIVLWQGRETGEYKGGLIFVHGKIDGQEKYYNGFVDSDLNYIIDLDIDGISTPPFYIGDYALVQCTNSGGVSFVTLIDKQGKMLFEPKQGKSIFWGANLSQYSYFSDYVIIVDDNIMILNIDGTTESVYNTSTDGQLRCIDGTYYSISGGEIRKYTY